MLEEENDVKFLAMIVIGVALYTTTRMISSYLGLDMFSMGWLGSAIAVMVLVKFIK